MKRFDFAKRLSVRAGKRALIFFRSAKNFEFTKEGGKSDFYTSADTEAEKIILAGIQKHFPNDEILSEESPFKAGAPGKRWIVDPIDGSIPFLVGFPMWGVSLGYVKNGETQFGVIYTPNDTVLISAELGKGAWVNGLQTRITREVDLDKAIVAVDYSKQRDTQEVANVTGKLINHIRYPFTFASSAFSVSAFLQGRIHAFAHPRPDEFDKAGLDVLIREAGGQISTFEGNPFVRGKNCSLLISCSPRLQEQLIHILN